MPWMETTKVEQRKKFIRQVLAGEASVAAACRQFKISRPTGYKWLARYKEFGIDGLRDRSRAPHEIPHKTSAAIEAAIVNVRKKYSSLGPRKIRSMLRTKRPDVDWPAASTMGDILSRHGLTKPRKRKRNKVPKTKPLADVKGPNDLWTIDFKGQFRLGNRRYCYPLTVMDAHSRLLLGCFSLKDTKAKPADACMVKLFEEFGLPNRIRSDNGSPFASRGLAGLTTLTARWVEMGIGLERIDPGNPQQNGAHERMHLTLKEETARPGADDHDAQQRVFDDFLVFYNELRPHEALGQRPPATAYAKSTRRPEDAVPDYRHCDLVRPVYKNGALYLRGRGIKVQLSLALRGRNLGLTEDDDGLWLIQLGPKVIAMYDEHDNSLDAMPEDGLVEFPPEEAKR